jgi:hypothetical protein
MQSINYDQSRVTNLHQIKTSFGLQNRQKQRSWNTGANKQMTLNKYVHRCTYKCIGNFGSF